MKYTIIATVSIQWYRDGKLVHRIGTASAEFVPLQYSSRKAEIQEALASAATASGVAMDKLRKELEDGV